MRPPSSAAAGTAGLWSQESEAFGAAWSTRAGTSEYLADAAAHGLVIEAVVNTHFHADFIAGHLELAAKTEAWIGCGQRAEADYPIRKLADGERISLGDVMLQIIETPAGPGQRPAGSAFSC